VPRPSTEGPLNLALILGTIPVLQHLSTLLGTSTSTFLGLGVLSWWPAATPLRRREPKGQPWHALPVATPAWLVAPASSQCFAKSSPGCLPLNSAWKMTVARMTGGWTNTFLAFIVT